MDSTGNVGENELKIPDEQETKGQNSDKDISSAAKDSIKDKYSQQTKKELFASFDKLRGDINSLRNELNNSSSNKELWYRKKEELFSAIGKKIEAIKESRKKKDDLTKEVKGLKEKRNSFNEEAKKKIEEIVKLNDESKNLTKKSKIKDPFQLKKDIDALESKLETEVMSFEKEKELSKKLRALKKSFEDASALIVIINNIKKLNSELGAARKSNNGLHNQIQKLAGESQEIHESILKGSKEIDELKIKEEEAFKNFVESKKRFNNANKSLKEKLGEMGDIREAIAKHKLEEDEKRKLKEVTFIKSKEQEIEEKIKTGKKLTNEDFLVFQEAIKGKNM